MTADNDVLTLTMCVNYGGRAEIADATRRIAHDVADGRLEPELDRRAHHRPVPRQPRHARRRPVRAVLGGAAHQQLPAVAVGLRRDGVPRHARGPTSTAATCGGRSRSTPRATAATAARSTPSTPSTARADGAAPAGSLTRGPTRRQRPAAQSAQVPKISRVWRTSTNPCSALTVSAQRSTAGPSTSTVRPQARQTRWWWCPVLHRR